MPTVHNDFGVPYTVSTLVLLGVVARIIRCTSPSVNRKFISTEPRMVPRLHKLGI